MSLQRLTMSLLWCMMLGCASDAVLSEIIIVVDSDLRVPAELDRIEIEVREPNGDTQTAHAALGSGELLLPRRLGLVHREGPLGPLMIETTASLDGTTVVTRDARVSFQHGQSVMLKVSLLRECIDVACPQRETCAAGGCRTIDVDVDELVSIDADAGRLATTTPMDDDTRDAGRNGDASTGDGGNIGAIDAGGTDAAIDGGGMLGNDAAIPEQLVCGADDTCDLACTSGDCFVDCQQGAACDVDCAASDCTIVCRPQTSCDVICPGGNCAIDCKKNAECTSGDCTSGDCTCTGQGACL